MDRVKFGRALGYGARHAAKAVAQAVDAANTPSPQAPREAPGSSQPIPSAASPSPADSRLSQTFAHRKPVDTRAVRAAGSQAKSSFLTPVARFSSVIWLQLTGVFFGIVAFTMGAAAWRAHTVAQQSGAHGPTKLYAYVAVCALFTYFAISSFVRAGRK